MLQQLLTRLPNWAFNTAFFVLLLLFVFLALSPTMVFGKIDCKLADQRRCPRLSVNVNVEGRDVRTLVADGTGTFYIPVVSKLTGVSADLYYSDNNSADNLIPEQMEFDMPSIWGGREFRVKVRAKQQEGFEKIEIARSGGNWLFAAIGYFSGTDKANAQEIMTLESAAKIEGLLTSGDTTISLDLPSSQISTEVSSKIDRAVSDAIVSATGTSSQAVQSFDLRTMSIDQVETFDGIVSKQLGANIKPEHWGYIRSAQNASNYLKSVEALGIGETANQPWSQIQKEYAAQKGEALILAPNLGGQTIP
jgi:hypothetical protein